MSKADISVIVPVHNTEKYLNNCIDSILAQSYRSIEVILVDGGSTDGTGNICDEYGKRDERVKVIHKADNGVTSNRKAGLEASCGEFIAFVDGDDWVSVDMYESLMKKAKESGADIVTSGVIREHPKSSRVMYDALEPGLYTCDKEGLMQNNMVWLGDSNKKGIFPGLWNKLFKRDVIYDNYFSMDDRITHNEDEAAFIAAVLDSKSVYVLHEAFYHYRAWEGASSNKQDELFFERFNCWMLYLRRKLVEKEHAEKLERDIDRLALDQIVWGMETQFKFIGKNIFPRFVLPKDVHLKGNVVIYGAGLVGRGYYKQLSVNPKCRIVAWVDKAYEIYGSQVESIDVLDNLEYDTVLISVKFQNVAKQIEEELIDRGVDPNKLIWVRPVYVMDYIFGNYDEEGLE